MQGNSSKLARIRLGFRTIWYFSDNLLSFLSFFFSPLNLVGLNAPTSHNPMYYTFIVPLESGLCVECCENINKKLLIHLWVLALNIAQRETNSWVLELSINDKRESYELLNDLDYQTQHRGHSFIYKTRNVLVQQYCHVFFSVQFKNNETLSYTRTQTKDIKMGKKKSQRNI